jgi:hypothetical protein
MLPAALLSEPGTGGTTFVGLFYLAQTRLATEHGDTFRFSTPPMSMQRLSPLYEQLVAGDFPRPLAPEDAAQIRFEMAFDEPRHRGLFHSGAEFEPKYRAECRWVRSGFDEILAALETGRDVAGAFGSLAGCTTPIFLLEARPSAPPAGAAPRPARDVLISKILEALALRSAPNWAPDRRRLHPAFVFARIDSVPEDLVPGISHGDLLDEDVLLREGARLGHSLVETLLPQTASFCRSSAVNVAEPTVYFSYLREAPGSDLKARHLLTRTLPDHHHEPVYPFTQFRQLIDHLGELGREDH